MKSGSRVEVGAGDAIRKHDTRRFRSEGLEFIARKGNTQTALQIPVSRVSVSVAGDDVSREHWLASSASAVHANVTYTGDNVIGAWWQDGGSPVPQPLGPNSHNWQIAYTNRSTYTGG